MADLSAVAGAGAFLGSSAALLYAATLAGVVREALHPERKTVGWALGRGLPSEPDAWGLPAREWSHSFRGALSPVWEIGAEDPAAPTFVVTHGFARSRYDSLSRLGPMLAHCGRFLLPDLPGHGDAAGRGTRLGTDEDHLLSTLVAAATSGPVVLVGHSLGAVSSIHAATHDAIAARVRGVIALAPYERLRTPLAARLDLRALPKAPLLVPAIALLSARGVVERSTREAAARLRCPLAVVAGALDPVTPLDEARAIAAAAPRATLAIVEQGRHDDFHSLGQAEMNAALAWIASAASITR